MNYRFLNDSYPCLLMAWHVSKWTAPHTDTTLEWLFEI